MTATTERARHAALRRYRDPDDPEVAKSRQTLKSITAEEFVRRIVDEAPPLTIDQRARLARILTGDAV